MVIIGREQELGDLPQPLQIRYRDVQDVHGAGNSFISYEEGNRRARFAPDVYVVCGVPKGLRRVYKLWEEGQPAAVVFEFTSRSTALEDRGNKKALCENLGVMAEAEAELACLRDELARLRGTSEG